MRDDRISVDDPPVLSDRLTPDDAPEQLGDDFEISIEERHRLTIAAQWGKSMILAARAGSQQALDDLRTRMHVTEYRTVRS